MPSILHYNYKNVYSVEIGFKGYAPPPTEVYKICTCFFTLYLILGKRLKWLYNITSSGYTVIYLPIPLLSDIVGSIIHLLMKTLVLL